MSIARERTDRLIGLAIEVHRHTAPGHLESFYKQCPGHELREASIPFERQMPIPLIYKPMPTGNGFKANVIVAREIIPEIKSIAAILPIHEAQRHTHLRLSSLRIGPIPNANARRLTEEIRRFIPEPQ